MTDTAVTRLAAFAVSAVPPKAHRARAADALLDTIGCMVLGRDAPVTRVALEAGRDWGAGPAPVPATGCSLPVPHAALVGGAAAHSYDLDDYTLIANDHPSAVMVPALLAQAAVMPRTSGAALLDAYLVGLEVIFRAGEAVNMQHYNRGWHTTATLDSLGATAAVARLTGLSADQTAMALSLTTSLTSGFVSQFGTMAKPLHAGIAAQAGITACALARAGATADPGVLDGPVSLATIMTPDGAPGFDAALAGLGQSWGLDRFGLGAKLYPSCGYTHRGIDGGIELHRRLGGPDPDQIASVELSLPDFHLAILPYCVPESRDQALFSAPWCAAVALVTGQCSSADFTEEGIARAPIRALTARTRAVPRKPRDPAINLDPADPDRVVVTLTDGRIETASIDLWTGAPGRDLGREGLRAKFFDTCATAGLTRQSAESLADVIQSLDGSTNLAALMFGLRSGVEAT